MKISVIVVILLVLTQIPAAAVTLDTYSGKWIWQSVDGPGNTWACFRKSFDLTQVPATAITKISVDSKYWLWINEQLVVFEGGLKQGPTPNDSYYDQLDIAEYLKVGKNTIAVMVWFFGKDGMSHINRGKGALFMECEINNMTIVSDNSWKMKVHPAYENTSGDNPNWRLPESNVRFNAQKDNMGNWKAIDYDDSSWSAAVEKGTPTVSPWGNLWLRPIPQWKNSGLVDYVEINVTLPFTTTGTETIMAKLPHNVHLTPYLDIEATAGKVIDMRTDAYEPGSKNYSVRAEYVTKSGSQQYESYGWMNGHYVYYKIPAGVTINSLKYRETGYDCEFTGSFTCNDDFFNTLWKKAQLTLYVNMRDTYMDCPDRERALWWGDAVLEIGEAFYALDRKSDMLAKKCISNLVKWQKSDNSLYAPVPAGNWDRELPLQTLASIGEYGFWTYYFYSGDKEAIVDAYPHVKKYLTIWSFDSDGLIEHRGGGWNYNGPWDWTDWGNNIDERVIDNCWYYMALKAARKMAILTNNLADSTIYDTQIQKIESNFNRVLWRGNYYKSPGYSGEIDDRANGLAVVAGLADSSKWSKIRTVLGTYRHASPYMEKYVLEALYMMGYENDALKRMKRADRYAPMVNNNVTTLYENFGNNGTFNHGWSGGPLTLLSQYAAGVAPETVAFETYHVFPQEGDLISIKSVTPSVKGNIEVEIEKDNLTYTLKLNSPLGTVAKVGIPKFINTNTATNTISLNNTEIWRDGSSTGTIDGANYIGENSKYYIFSVEPGVYDFSATSSVGTDTGNINKSIPKEFRLYQNYPNPFNPITKIRYQLSQSSDVELVIYNSIGQKITTLVSDRQVAGNYDYVWDAGNLASDIYICRLQAGNDLRFNKMLLVK